MKCLSRPTSNCRCQSTDNVYIPIAGWRSHFSHFTSPTQAMTQASEASSCTPSAKSRRAFGRRARSASSRSGFL